MIETGWANLLPRDVFKIVLSHLNLEEIELAGKVCTKWNEVANSDDFWAFLIREDFPRIYKFTVDSTRMPMKQQYGLISFALSHNWDPGQEILNHVISDNT